MRIFSPHTYNLRGTVHLFYFHSILPFLPWARSRRVYFSALLSTEYRKKTTSKRISRLSNPLWLYPRKQAKQQQQCIHTHTMMNIYLYVSAEARAHGSTRLLYPVTRGKFELSIINMGLLRTRIEFLRDCVYARVIYNEFSCAFFSRFLYGCGREANL